MVYGTYTYVIVSWVYKPITGPHIVLFEAKKYTVKDQCNAATAADSPKIST